MKKIVLVILLTVEAMLYSQELNIAGIVYDDQLSCLQSAEVSIANSDNHQVASMSTGLDGTFAFHLHVEACDKLFLHVSHMSYIEKNIEINNCDTTLSIYMELLQYIVDDVEIVAKKPLFENIGEKTVVNVEQLTSLNALSSDKMLSRLPGVTASSKEGLTYNGQAATLYINGIEQRMNGKMAVSLLESLPTSMIKQVELVAINDGSSSALNNGVTINIVMKEMAFDGYSARVGGYISYNDKPNNDFGGSGQGFFIMKKNRLTFNANISYKNELNWHDASENSRYNDSSTLVSKSYGGGRINIFTGLANLGYEFKNSHNLNFNFFFYDDYSNSDIKQHINKKKPNYDDEQYRTNYKGSGHDDLWTGNIEYSTPDTLINSFKTSYGIVYGGLRSTTNFYRNDTIESNSYEWYLNDKSQMTGNQHDFKFDFKHIFKDESTLKLGLLADIGILNDVVDYDEPLATNYYKSSKFKGIEQCYESYANYKRDLGKYFSLSASLRYVHIHQDFYYISDDKTLSNNYDYIFPFAYINFKKGIYNGMMGFVSGMIKPNYNSMLPGARQEDDYTIMVGNPNIKPCTNYGIAFNSIFWKTLFVSLRYEKLNDIDGYILNENSSSDIKVYEYKNYADIQRFYTRVSTPYSFLNERIYGDVDATIIYRDMINLKNGYKIDEGRSKSYWEMELRGSFNYKIAKGLNVYLWARYLPTTNKPSEKVYSRWTMDAGISYQWGKNDMFLISFDGEDLFDTNGKFSTEKYYYGSICKQTIAYNTRILKLSFAIKFKGGESIDKHSVDYSKTDVERFSK